MTDHNAVTLRSFSIQTGRNSGRLPQRHAHKLNPQRPLNPKTRGHAPPGNQQIFHILRDQRTKWYLKKLARPHQVQSLKCIVVNINRISGLSHAVWKSAALVVIRLGQIIFADNAATFPHTGNLGKRVKFGIRKSRHIFA